MQSKTVITVETEDCGTPSIEGARDDEGCIRSSTRTGAAEKSQK